MPVSVETVALDQIESDWEDSLPACWTNTIFVTPWWQKTWLKHFGVDSTVRILKITDGNGMLIGIAPMSVSEGVVTFLGSTDLFDYHDFLVIRGVEEKFYPATLDEIETWDWDTIDLKSVPEDSPTIPCVSDVATKKGWHTEIVEEDKSPIKPLADTWDDYLQGLRKKHRHELRRKIRKLSNTAPVTQYDCTPEMLPGCLPDFFRLHRLSSPEKAEFMTEARERFFTEIMEIAAERGHLKLSMLELDGVRVAACVSFDYGDAYLLYNSGYDPTHSQLSVGLVNKARAIKDAIESGKRTFNFLRGVERYKYDLGAEDRSVYAIQIRR